MNIIWGAPLESVEDLQVGDIIGFELNGVRILHRITGFGSDGSIFVWGDNMQACVNGERVFFDNVHFRMIGFIKIV